MLRTMQVIDDGICGRYGGRVTNPGPEALGNNQSDKQESGLAPEPPGKQDIGNHFRDDKVRIWPWVLWRLLRFIFCYCSFQSVS